MYLSGWLRGLAALTLLVAGGEALADGGATHQTSNDNFGVSGGNVNDRSRTFCCSGTLGSLVTDGNVSYILSNNHVLGRSGKAVAGEDISQPGLIDNNCRVPEIVADFTVAPSLLGSNVDAAIAKLRLGAMSATGEIQDIGVPSAIVRAPTVGLGVAKSGRTTGLTTGSITSINASVSVQYQQGCGGGKKFTASFTNQVVVGSSSFSAGGDSGSLIVTNDSCHQPVALLFAGSSTTTIGNPIGQVLAQVGAALGRSVSFVGTQCDATSTNIIASNDTTTTTTTQGGGGPGRGPAGPAVDHARGAHGRSQGDIMSRRGVIGYGVGASSQNPDSPALIVYVDVTEGVTPTLPNKIENVDVEVVYTEPFVAF
jgi:hypothetical protein